eukprot:SAG22_NODE_349_length_11854_cov_8.087282_8_plen_407_part_00
MSLKPSRQLFPEFWAENLIGARAENELLDRAVALVLPRVASKLESAGGLTVAMFATQWTLTLFAKVVPLAAGARLFDAMLSSAAAPTVLPRLVLALLQHAEPRLLAPPPQDCEDELTFLFEQLRALPKTVLAEPAELEAVLALAFSAGLVGDGGLLQLRREIRAEMAAAEAEAAAAATADAAFDTLDTGALTPGLFPRRPQSLICMLTVVVCAICADYDGMLSLAEFKSAMLTVKPVGGDGDDSSNSGAAESVRKRGITAALTQQGGSLRMPVEDSATVRLRFIDATVQAALDVLVEKIFAAADTDGSGGLSRAEFTSLARSASPGLAATLMLENVRKQTDNGAGDLVMPRSRLQTLYNRFDTTGSGSLSLPELTKLVATIYSSADGLRELPSKAEVAAVVSSSLF